jgi:hypothetical protein
LIATEKARCLYVALIPAPQFALESFLGTRQPEAGKILSTNLHALINMSNAPCQKSRTARRSAKTVKATSNIHLKLADSLSKRSIEPAKVSAGLRCMTDLSGDEAQVQ